jgi:hypothetical protein
MVSRDDMDVMEWLLEPEQPSVRYLALRDLVGAKGAELEEARLAIMEAGPVPRILDRQEPEGHWGRPEDFYVRSKYRGTVWNLILLADLCADPADKRVRRACEFVLRWSQDRSSGGFSYRGTGERGGTHSGVLSCLTGNMVFSLIRLGHLEDERVASGLDWLTRYMRFSLEPMGTREWPFSNPRCWGRHTCRSGAVKALKALAEVPAPRRTPAMRRCIEEGAEFLLRMNIVGEREGGLEVKRPEWLQLGFPRMWSTDILEILDILTRLGYQDERMHRALGLLLGKRQPDGRWLQEDRYHGRYLISFGANGRPGKWTTLMAMRVLQAMPR